ncbi:MAG: TonB-dependent receptor [Candidatus Eremiobacteraeota bacterium]|nr:TonB-dependent receptor [Candidatus Eremiobacteraeota bacterium]
MRLAGTIVFLALAFMARAAAATVGSIHGVVVDATSRHPLAGVKIELLSPSGGYSATTDARGFYSIVGIIPDTYALIADAAGYRPFSEPGITISQDTNVAIDAALLRASLREIGHVTALPASFPVQPHQPTDVYVVSPHEQAQLGGIPAFDNEAQLLNTLPGATLVGGASGSGLVGGFAAVRGGLANQIGYQLDGVDATDPITGYFINNVILNGSQSVDFTAGPGDASKGGSGSGFVNIVTKAGSYPSSGFVQLDGGGPAFEHNLDFEYGTATPNKRYSLFVSGRYGRDFGGVTAPPYGNTYGGTGTSFPDTLGQVQFETTNDTVVNGLIHFGRNDANTIQLWGVWGANKETGGYGIDPQTYPFYTGLAPYQQIYQAAPQLLGIEARTFGIPILNPSATNSALSLKDAEGLMPFFPGQNAVNQPIGAVPNEVTTYDLMKIAYSRQLSPGSYINARIYRTQNAVVDNFNDPNNVLFGYGLPSVGFSDNFVTRATQNTGFAIDVQQQAGSSHLLSLGYDYRFSRANLEGYVVSPTLFFAGPTIADFLPSDPYLAPGANSAPTPGVFYGKRYPAFNETIDNDMYRTSLYATDNWNVNDRALLQLGLRYDKQNVPTQAGTYEANAIDPRVAGTWTIGRRRNTVLRAGYGHAATFAPLFQLVSEYTPPIGYRNDPATLAICGGPTANFAGRCANYYDELVNAWWRGFGVNPVSFSRPQQSDSYDISLEHAFPHEIGFKLTFFDRRDYDVIVNSQQVTVTPQGAVIPGTISVTNQGRAQTAGLELQLSRQVPQGLSVQLNATYVNQFVNYVTSNAFRPSVQPALLATGALFHPPYLSPLTAALTLDYHRHDWEIDPIFRFENGYPIGIWAMDPVYVNGSPMFVPNTNLYGGFGSQFCYYVDPQDPGDPQHPRIIGSTGGGCSATLNGALTHRALFVNLLVARSLERGHVTLGLEVQNLLGNYANYPYYNPGYVNNGYGAFGPGSGSNPVFGLPGAIKAYPAGPYFSVPSGFGRQITVFSRFAL